MDFRTATMLVYGLCIVASGLFRYFSSDGGHAGLWFGIVMGTVALIAGGSYWLGKRSIGHVLAWLTVAFVGGWFCYEFFYKSLIKKGWAEAETRLLLMFGLSVVVGVILLASHFKPKNAPTQ